jgi:hypothetical protein
LQQDAAMHASRYYGQRFLNVKHSTGPDIQLIGDGPKIGKVAGDIVPLALIIRAPSRAGGEAVF